MKFLGAILLIGAGILGIVSMIVYSSNSQGSKWIEIPTEITYTYSIQAYGGKTDSGLEYIPHPSYSFVVDGQRYVGSVYSIPDGRTRSLNFLQGATETPAIVNGSIFYNPNDPNQSSVERPFFNFIPLLFLGLFAFGFLIIGCLLINDIWKNRATKLS